MNLFSLSGLLLTLTAFVLSIILLIFNRNKLHRIWLFFNVSVGVWGVGSLLIGSSNNVSDALFAWKFSAVGVTFIPVFFYHLIFIFCDLKSKNTLRFVYLQAFLFLILNLFGALITHVEFILGHLLYNKASWPIFYIYSFIWLMIVILGHFELLKYYLISKGIKKHQAQYLLLGLVVGFSGGVSNFLPQFNINVYPFGNFTILVYCLISTYAILKYHILDIKVAVTRLGVFLFVYFFVLGIPFLIGMKFLGVGLWLIPTGVCAALATAGPFIYLFLQKKAENRIRQDEIRLLDLLKNAAYGMRRVRDLDKLLEVVIDILTSGLRLNNAGVYLNEEEQYVLRKSKIPYSNHIIIDLNDPLIKRLAKEKNPIIFDEVKLFLEGQPGDEDLREIVKQMRELSAQAIVPILAQDFLLGFIVLGERRKSEVYSKDLINILLLVGDRAGLSIENAIYLKESEKTLAQKSHDARLRAIGGMGSGVAHQIRNRVNIITGHISFFLPVLEKADLKNVTIEKAVEWLERAKKIMKTIFENAMAAEKICIAINSYSKLTDEKESANLGVVFDMAVEVSRGRVDFDALDAEIDIPEDLMFYAVVPMIQDVFVNLIVNSRDAMEGKKERIRIGDWQIPDYRPKITVKARQESGKVIVYFSDNGTGFKPGHEQSAFVPFYTTKGTGVKGKDGGTGLGLNLIWDFLKKNGGDIELINEYKKGATFKMALPLPKHERKKDE